MRSVYPASDTRLQNTFITFMKEIPCLAIIMGNFTIHDYNIILLLSTTDQGDADILNKAV